VSIAEMLGIGFGGFVAGLVLFNGILRWVGTILVLAKDPTHAGSTGKGARIALATLFGSGFWLLVVAVWGAYFVHAEPYAAPLFVGSGAAILYMGSVVGWFLLRRRTRGGETS